MRTRTLELLTTSTSRLYRRCQRRYLHEVEQAIKPAYTSDNLTFGTLIHLGLEAWWRAAKASPRVDCEACGGAGTFKDAANELHYETCATCAGTGNTAPALWLSAALAALTGEPDLDVRVRAEAMILGYHHRWSDMTWDGHPITVLDVEREFTAPLLNPATGAESRTFQRAGKIDAICEVNGRVFVVEHKTSGEDMSPGSSYWRRLHIDQQVSNYHVGGRALGYEISGCFYDVLGKPTLKPYKATPADKLTYTKETKNQPSRLHAGQRLTDESPEEYGERILAAIGEKPDDYYQRAEVVRVGEDEADAAFDTWQIAVQIRESKAANRWPRNDDACFAYHKACPFLDVCSGVATIDDPTRFRRGRAHEELSQTADVAA